ncbi:hypothetical protein F511_39980 [Dorcoceras hygrometricum]|uniref:Uncharacterized protein n=1 Tax=Dorcoceras hygrometricum TaxID=472368 RepID=A0A2Z7BQK4_9LAMI|nr:hypothetical protein F511_39980 [Dorcoceras hygrometricum]
MSSIAVNLPDFSDRLSIKSQYIAISVKGNKVSDFSIYGIEDPVTPHLISRSSRSFRAGSSVQSPVVHSVVLLKIKMSSIAVNLPDFSDRLSIKSQYIAISVKGNKVSDFSIYGIEDPVTQEGTGLQ